MNCLANIENIISVQFIPEKEHWNYIWVPVTTKMVRKNRFKFWTKKEEVREGGFYGYYENKTNIDSLLDEEGDKLHFKETGNLFEGPRGTLFFKPYIVITAIGGKYTSNFYEYYDSNEQARERIQEIESLYPGKFLIIK
jgi:hypothetical protein